MNDLPLTAPLQSNLPEYSVSELSLALKRSIEESFSHVRVRGEISGFKRHSSGHCYFAPKDSDAASRMPSPATVRPTVLRSRGNDPRLARP